MKKRTQIRRTARVLGVGAVILIAAVVGGSQSGVLLAQQGVKGDPSKIAALITE